MRCLHCYSLFRVVIFRGPSTFLLLFQTFIKLAACAPPPFTTIYNDQEGQAHRGPSRLRAIILGISTLTRYAAARR